MFKIVVCVKAVPDPKEACNIKIDPVTKTLLRCDVPMVLNPLDKYALEAALQFKEQFDAHISVLSMGPPEAGNIVKECLALGADQGFLLSDRAFAVRMPLPRPTPWPKVLKKSARMTWFFAEWPAATAARNGSDRKWPPS